MREALYILFGAGLTWVVCLALGRLLLRKLHVPYFREEEYGLAFVSGAACLSMLVFGLAAAQLFYKGTVLAIAALAVGGAWRGGVLTPLARGFPRLEKRLLWLYSLPFALFFVLTFFHAMAPEMSPDGTGYHLAIVARYYREHGFSRITTNMYANLSQGVEMLFLYAFAFGRHSAAALVHFEFLTALAAMILSYARRFGYASAGLAAALIVFVTPVVGIDAASAYNDVAVATILFGVFYLLRIWEQTRSNTLWIPIGLLAGFAFGAKYTAFLGVPYALGVLAWRIKKQRVRALATVSLAAALMILPWLVKNTIVVANPVSPFFNKIFPNPYVHISFEEEYAHHMRNYMGLTSYWQIPAELILRGNVLCGLLGPLFLLTPVVLLGLRNSEVRRLLLAALLFGSVYVTNIGTRFLIPALPFLALALAMVLTRMKGLLPALVLAHTLSAWPPVMKLYSSPYAWSLDRILLKQGLRIESEEGYMQRKSALYSAARLIENKTPPGATVLSYNQIFEAYTTRNILVVYQSARGAVLGGIMLTPLIPEYQPTRRLYFRFDRKETRAIRVRQVNSNEPDHWTLQELRLFEGGHELARDPSWRLRAHPNPWDIQDAFDNRPVTRWGSWEKINPRMHIDVDLGAAHAIDMVSIETSPDVSKDRMEVDVQGGDGQWHTVSTKPVEIEVAPPLGLRREAAEVLRSRGIEYILEHDDDFAAKDLAARKEDWGVRDIGDVAGYHLYRIE